MGRPRPPAAQVGLHSVDFRTMLSQACGRLIDFRLVGGDQQVVAVFCTLAGHVEADARRRTCHDSKLIGSFRRSFSP